MKVVISLLVLCLCSWLSIGKAGAQEKFRVASGGFSTAIHALLWVAYEKRFFKNTDWMASISLWRAAPRHAGAAGQ